MNKMRFLLAFALAAAPLGAQEPMKRDSMHAGMMAGTPATMMQDEMMQHMMGSMLRAMAYAPDHLLMRKDRLNLTAAQVARLTALRDAAKAAHDGAAADAKPHLQALEQAMSGASPDTAAVKVHFLEAHKAMGVGHWALLAAAAQAKAVLTDAQRAKVQAWADSLQAAMQQRRDMMGPMRPH